MKKLLLIIFAVNTCMLRAMTPAPEELDVQVQNLLQPNTIGPRLVCYGMQGGKEVSGVFTMRFIGEIYETSGTRLFMGSGDRLALVGNRPRILGSGQRYVDYVHYSVAKVCWACRFLLDGLTPAIERVTKFTLSSGEPATTIACPV